MGANDVNLKSPDYPENYPVSLACRWNVVSQGVRVSIEDFLTERFRDVLSLSGDTRDGGTDLTFELHGTTKILSIVFVSSRVTVSFSTDSTVSFFGFHLKLQNLAINKGEHTGSSVNDRQFQNIVVSLPYGYA